VLARGPVLVDEFEYAREVGSMAAGWARMAVNDIRRG